MGELAAGTMLRAIKHFVSVMPVTHPSQITTRTLETYYKSMSDPIRKATKKEPAETKEAFKKRSRSESTAQTYTARVASFARGIGLRVQSPKFPDAPSRKFVPTTVRVNELLELPADPELKFILFCGFTAGMRRIEITMARPEWFDFQQEQIRIPNPDPVTGWTPKSKRERTIPLVPEFAEWIKATYPDWDNREFCLRPEKKMGRWIYRYDFRKVFEAFAKKHEPRLTTHVMRHTFTTVQAHNPKVSIAELSEWTGDRIATLEKHYIHMKTNAAKSAESYRPKKPDDTAEQIQYLRAQLAALGADVGLVSDY